MSNICRFSLLVKSVDRCINLFCLVIIVVHSNCCFQVVLKEFSTFAFFSLIHVSEFVQTFSAGIFNANKLICSQSLQM